MYDFKKHVIQQFYYSVIGCKTKIRNANIWCNRINVVSKVFTDVYNLKG